jgi:hypothetical protein
MAIGLTLIDRSGVRDETGRRINSGNVCYYEDPRVLANVQGIAPQNNIFLFSVWV